MIVQSSITRVWHARRNRLVHFVVSELDRVLNRRGRDVSLQYLHAAAPAPSPLAAGGGDIDPRRPGGVENRRVGGADDGATLSTGRVVDEGYGEFLRHADLPGDPNLAIAATDVRSKPSSVAGGGVRGSRDDISFGAGSRLPARHSRLGRRARVRRVALCRIRGSGSGSQRKRRSRRWVLAPRMTPPASCRPD